MSELLVWLIIGVGLAYVTNHDLRDGQVIIPNRRGPVYVRRAEYPLLFFAMISVRVLGGLFLILLLTGRLLPLIQWGA